MAGEITLKNRVPTGVKEAHREGLLAAENPREAARVLAAELGIRFGVMWEWLLGEARARARRAIPEPLVLASLLDEPERARLVAVATGDRTLETAGRLDALLTTCEATPNDIRQLMQVLPKNGCEDWLFESLLFHPQVPEDLLYRLLAEGRCLTALCHRAGPRKLLEELLRLRPGSTEVVLGLAADYATDSEVSVEDFVAFVREHRGCVSLCKWLENECVPERRDPAKRAQGLKLFKAAAPTACSTAPPSISRLVLGNPRG